MTRELTQDSGWHGDRRRGASMGRAGNVPDDTAKPRRFTLQRVRIDSQGYDSGGAYWGLGAPLYWYCSDDGQAEGFFRITGGHFTAQARRDAAKAEVRKLFPDATFHR